MRKTKIICTLGPATDSSEMLARLIAAGANVFRLNMSHGTHEWVREVVPRIREVARQTSANIAIMMDTQGPAIRTGDVATNLDLHPGDVVEFTVRGAKSEEHYSVDVNYDGLIDDIHEGDVVMVDNGNIHMKVLAKKENRVQCEVLTRGVLGSRRHINLPGVKVNLPPMTEKDLKDIVVGVETEVDYFALSFCRERSDVEAMRAELRRLGSDAHIIAKIEDQHAVKHVKEIIDAADAVMVARGDLGIECPMEELPIIQRRIVKSCLQVGKPVIVATHMLESMITNPLPTRAEITDVANAVYEQADAIMLSGETSVGKYPVQCVETFDRVARRIERSGGAGFAADAVIDRQAVVAHAVRRRADDGSALTGVGIAAAPKAHRHALDVLRAEIGRLCPGRTLDHPARKRDRFCRRRATAAHDTQSYQQHASCQDCGNHRSELHCASHGCGSLLAGTL